MSPLCKPLEERGLFWSGAHNLQQIFLVTYTSVGAKTQAIAVHCGRNRTALLVVMLLAMTPYNKVMLDVCVACVCFVISTQPLQTQLRNTKTKMGRRAFLAPAILRCSQL